MAARIGGERMTNLILCGGIGSRLWPVSRSLMPKQFYPLINGKSLFEDTLKRNNELVDSFALALNRDQFLLAQDQMLSNDLKSTYTLIEPCGRNTAPAIALVCLSMPKDEVLLVTPSDHLISNKSEYTNVLKRAKLLAEGGNLVTFGIKPTFAETGFGYIEADNEDVVSFKEKPDSKTAEIYFKSGNYYWNSGMFCFTAETFLSELEKYSPDVYNACVNVHNSCDKNEIEPTNEDMLKIPSISIDYAVMEKSKKVKVVPSDIGWSDLGSFDSLYTEMYTPLKENAIVGQDNVILIDSTNNLIMSDNRKVACVDVEDLLIVDSVDALLIAKRGSSQKVKDVVSTLKQEGSSLLEAPVTVKRPWGSYTVLQDEETFKVKQIEVKSGKRLSLQYHEKREEHWTIVDGSARVTIGDKEVTLGRNETVFIPKGVKHRLENLGHTTLVLIETQIGSYFGEDDILRLEDDWGRVKEKVLN